MLVAFTQITITIGAGMGTLIFDKSGINLTYGSGSIVLVLVGQTAYAALKNISQDKKIDNALKINVE